jgi:hypothetical protein
MSISTALAQSAPSATSLTDVYTCPAGKRAVVRVIAVERSGAAATFRVSVAINGAADSNEQYVSYDEAIGANASVTSAPLSIDASDIVRVYASSANLSFTVTGIEQTI